MKFFAILSRYINRQLLFHFLIVFFGILGIILMFNTIEALRKISGRDDVSLWFAGQFAIARMSKTISIVFPFVMMVAAMITFWRLSKNSEFVIIRSAGVSMFGFLKPMMILAFLLGLLNITVLNPIESKLFEWHEELGLKLATHNPNAVLFSSKGLWIREAVDKDKVLLIQAKTLRQDDDKTVWMRDVSITELNKKAQIEKSYQASFATLDGNTFYLKDVKVLIGGKPVESLTDYAYQTSITVQRIKDNFIEPAAISFWHLPDTISFYEKAGFSARKHWMRFLNLLISPFLLIGMLMLAAVFMLQNTLRGSALLLRVVISIVTGFTFYFSSQVIFAFGMNGYIPVWLAVLAPTLILWLVTTSLLIRADEV